MYTGVIWKGQPHQSHPFVPFIRQLWCECHMKWSENMFNFIVPTLIHIFLKIWDTTEVGPGWDSNSQPSNLWAKPLSHLPWERGKRIVLAVFLYCCPDTILFKWAGQLEQSGWQWRNTASEHSRHTMNKDQHKVFLSSYHEILCFSQLTTKGCQDKPNITTSAFLINLHNWFKWDLELKAARGLNWLNCNEKYSAFLSFIWQQLQRKWQQNEVNTSLISLPVPSQLVWTRLRIKLARDLTTLRWEVFGLSLIHLTMAHFTSNNSYTLVLPLIHTPENLNYFFTCNNSYTQNLNNFLAVRIIRIGAVCV